MLSISALQHYAYCPRQFALIHLEQAWVENKFTAEGRVLHARVDNGAHETRREIRYERGIALISYAHGLIGKMDLLEIETQADGTKIYFPVEYKRGKPKIEDWDRIQLCAQVLCLEEMRNISVAEGSVWYWQTRQRERVSIDAKLRRATLNIIAAAREVWESGKTPAPTKIKSRCNGCSLVDICRPSTFRRDFSESYIKELFEK